VQSDQELVEACCRGDRAAAEALVRRYQSSVYTLALRMLRDEDEARDAAQTVFLNALRSLHLFRGGSSLKTWLYRITVNECTARGKRRARFPKASSCEAEDPVAAVPDTRPLVSDTMNGEEQELHRAVLALPESYRLPVLMRYFEDLSYEDTARVLGISVNTVKVRLFRAKAILRTILAERGEA